MNKLHIEGYLGLDSDKMIAVSYTKEGKDYNRKSIPYTIEKYAQQYGKIIDYDKGLGGTKSYIENVSLRMYATNEKCDLDSAVESLVYKMFGDVETDISLEGYSEWTITGYCLEDFTIGGHDLERELKSYLGKYIHLILEFEY